MPPRRDTTSVADAIIGTDPGVEAELSLQSTRPREGSQHSCHTSPLLTTKHLKAHDQSGLLAKTAVTSIAPHYAELPGRQCAAQDRHPGIPAPCRPRHLTPQVQHPQQACAAMRHPATPEALATWGRIPRAKSTHTCSLKYLVDKEIWYAYKMT
jgi:hypothetical protein